MYSILSIAVPHRKEAYSSSRSLVRSSKKDICTYPSTYLPVLTPPKLKTINQIRLCTQAQSRQRIPLLIPQNLLHHREEKNVRAGRALHRGLEDTDVSGRIRFS